MMTTLLNAIEALLVLLVPSVMMINFVFFS